MENDVLFCNICGMEFKDELELSEHKKMAHATDPLGEDSDLRNTEDPTENQVLRR